MNIKYMITTSFNGWGCGKVYDSFQEAYDDREQYVNEFWEIMDPTYLAIYKMTEQEH